MKKIILIAHNLRSTHNVGSLLRTAEGLGVKEVYLTGYTPYPALTNDVRLPHLSQKIDSQIHKTALGAEKHLVITVSPDIDSVLDSLSIKGFSLVALEQHQRAVDLKNFKSPPAFALIVGNEIEGIAPDILSRCQFIIEIPMKGHKESFNVVQAAAMALYTLML